MNQRDGIAWLIESLQKCRMMIKHAGNAIFAIDPESGRLLEANIKAEEMTGCSESELRGLEVWDLHPEGEKEIAKELFDRVVSTGKAEECDMSLASNDGGVVRVDVSASMIEFGGTRIIQRICKDVTDHRELEARNEEQRRYYENILNMMPVGLGVRKNPGENPTIEFENESLKRMFHVDGEDPRHDHWWTVGLDESTDSDAFFTGDGFVAEERQQPDGRVLQYRSSYIRDEYGSWSEIQVVEDVTERARLREKLLRANEQLERRVQERTRELREKQVQLVQSEKMAALGSLVAGVAHEINTPLGALHSNNDVFVRSFDKIKSLLSDPSVPQELREDPDLKKLFDAIDDLTTVNRTATRRIVAVVDSLRNFARLEESEQKEADLHEGLESTLTLVRHQLRNRIKVVKKLGDIPYIRCYPNRLHPVFMNLLVNAIQAIDDKGTITVSTYLRAPGDTVVVEVQDTGRGIEREDLARIFDPGFTTKGAGVGTGLGLSIVYQIVKDHDGAIEVDSEVGSGTSFRVVLPVGR